MTQEEKARAYDKIVKEAEDTLRDLAEDYQFRGTLTKDEIKSILGRFLPQFAESEDERIRKEIIKHFEDLRNNKWLKDKIPSYLAWLEKQKEQKPADKVEPIEDGLETEFQKQVSHLIASAMNREHEYNLGFIQWVAQSLFGYAQHEQKPNPYILCKSIKDKIKTYIANHFITDEVVKTDVASIVHAMEEGVRFGMAEQKPVEWSEEDTHKTERLLYLIASNKGFNREHRDEAINIIKSLRPQPQKREWSEKDRDNMNHIRCVLDDCYCFGRHDLNKADRDKLMALINSLDPENNIK